MTNEYPLGNDGICSCQMSVDLLFFAISVLGGKQLTMHKGTLRWGEYILDERRNTRVIRPVIIPVVRCYALDVIQHRQGDALQLEVFPLLPYALLDRSPYIEGLLPCNFFPVKMDVACV